MLPEQVRKRAERANELVAQLQQGENPGEPATPPAPAPAPANPPADPPQNPPAPSPAAAPAEPPATPPAPAPAVPEDAEHWRQKYLTLQGVLNAESRRWQQKEQTFESRIAALEAAPKTPPAPAAPAPAPASQFSQDEIDRFGPELLNLVTTKAGSMADEIVTRKLAEFVPKMESVERKLESVGQTLYADKNEEFWGELHKAVPDLDAVNQRQDWLVWLGQEDDLSGTPRQLLLEKAQARLDFRRVAKMFDAFKKEAGLVPAAASPASAPAPAAPVVSPSPRTVGNGGTGNVPREPEAPSVKRSDIAAHYRRSTTDPTYRKSAEYTDMEQRIMQAQTSGRVMQG